jgi:hypothetical protein
MAKMIRPDPDPMHPLPREGWQLTATEVGRFATGLRATVQVWNGTMQTVQQLALAHPASWSDFIRELSVRLGMDDEPLVRALLELAGGVEGVLRQMEAQQEARGASQATELVELAGAAELFHDPHGEAYATIEVDGQLET